jgi:hypothetical protein
LRAQSVDEPAAIAKVESEFRTHPNEVAQIVSIVTAAIEAYEAAMWVSRDDTPRDTDMLVEARDGHVTTYHICFAEYLGAELVPIRSPIITGRFRPLPKPPEVKK